MEFTLGLPPTGTASPNFSEGLIVNSLHLLYVHYEAEFFRRKCRFALSTAQLRALIPQGLDWGLGPFVTLHHSSDENDIAASDH